MDLVAELRSNLCSDCAWPNARDGLRCKVCQLKVDAADEIEALRAALELACPPDPFDGGDLPCGFCGVDPGSAHKQGCAWVVGRSALERRQDSAPDG
jgi:hypothetical protein